MYWDIRYILAKFSLASKKKRTWSVSCTDEPRVYHVPRALGTGSPRAPVRTTQWRKHVAFRGILLHPWKWPCLEMLLWEQMLCERPHSSISLDARALRIFCSSRYPGDHLSRYPGDHLSLISPQTASFSLVQLPQLSEESPSRDVARSGQKAPPLAGVRTPGGPCPAIPPTGLAASPEPWSLKNREPHGAL